MCPDTEIVTADHQHLTKQNGQSLWQTTNHHKTIIHPPREKAVAHRSRRFWKKYVVVIQCEIMIFSGTIFKQLKRIHEKGFSREELLGCRPYIIENIIRNMAQLCHATKTVPLNVRSENVERRDRFAALARNERVMLQIVESWGESMACDFELLWHDDG